MTEGKNLIIGRGKRQQRHAARPLDGGSQKPLMARTIPGDAAGSHFPALRDELSDCAQILIIDPECLVGAKAADFAPEHGPTARCAFFLVRSLTAGSRAAFKLCHNWNYLFPQYPLLDSFRQTAKRAAQGPLPASPEIAMGA